MSKTKEIKCLKKQLRECKRQRDKLASNYQAISSYDFNLKSYIGGLNTFLKQFSYKKGKPYKKQTRF